MEFCPYAGVVLRLLQFFPTEEYIIAAVSEYNGMRGCALSASEIVRESKAFSKNFLTTRFMLGTQDGVTKKALMISMTC